MAAEIRLVRLVGPEAPVRGYRAHDGKPPRMLVQVGKSDALREVPLTKDQLLAIAEKAIHIARTMDTKERAERLAEEVRSSS